MACSASVFLVLLRTMNAPAASTSVSVIRESSATWHGVGLCQIGAAVMGEQGYHYDAILLHYYQGAEIKKLYK